MPNPPRILRYFSDGDFSGANNTPNYVSIPADMALTVYGDPGLSTTFAVEYTDGGSTTGLFILRAGRWKIFPGNLYRKVSYSSGQTGATWILGPMDRNDQGIWRLNTNADAIAVAPFSGFAGVPTTPPLATSPYPQDVSLSSVAVTDFSPAAGEVWELEVSDHVASAGAAGTITISRNAAFTQLIRQQAITAVAEQLGWQKQEVNFPGLMRVNITGGGVANTFVRTAGRRVQ